MHTQQTWCDGPGKSSLMQTSPRHEKGYRGADGSISICECYGSFDTQIVKVLPALSLFFYWWDRGRGRSRPLTKISISTRTGEQRVLDMSCHLFQAVTDHSFKLRYPVHATILLSTASKAAGVLRDTKCGSDLFLWL